VVDETQENWGIFKIQKENWECENSKHGYSASNNNDANTGACLFLLFVAGLWRRRSFSFSAFKPSVKKAY
jgi:hypothetical protein